MEIELSGTINQDVFAEVQSQLKLVSEDITILAGQIKRKEYLLPPDNLKEIAELLIALLGPIITIWMQRKRDTTWTTELLIEKVAKALTKKGIQDVQIRGIANFDNLLNDGNGLCIVEVTAPAARHFRVYVHRDGVRGFVRVE